MLAGFSNILWAQQQTRAEQIESIRVGYITRQLALTPGEAEVFWPVYNAYTAEVDEHRKRINRLEKNLRQAYLDDDTGKLETVMDRYVKAKAEESQILLKYHTSFKEVLSIRKVAMLYKAENDMKQRILEALRKRQQQNRRSGNRNR